MNVQNTKNLKKNEEADEEGYIEESEDDENNEEDTFAERDDRQKYKGMSNVGGGAIDLTHTQLLEEAIDQYANMMDHTPKIAERETLRSVSKPLPLVAAGHSLLPDMLLGWKP